MNKHGMKGFCYGLVSVALILSTTLTQAANDYVVAPNGGDITGAALSARLATGNVTLQSNAGSKSGAGNVIINDVVKWSANTTLTLTGSNNIDINANITASGANAGIVISPNSANGNEQASGSGSYNLVSSITLSGVTPSLTISGTRYIVINSLGAAADATTAPSSPTLQGMAAAANLANNYALGSDIDASATAAWNANAGFTPIGSEANPFSGVLDGMGHAIAGLNINNRQSVLVGLFGYMVGGAIRNVGLVDVNITGGTDVGALVGQNYNFSGSINNSFAQGSVSGYRRVGGLVGNNGGSIANSFANVNVTATGSEAGDGYGFGGLAGRNVNNINNSFAMGSITAQVDAGGLVGENYSGGAINNSYATGNIYTGSGNGGMSLGGLVGTQGDDENAGGSITNSYATGNVTCNITQNVNNCKYYGGLVGQMGGDNSGGGSVSNSYSKGIVTSNDQWGYAPSGLIGIVYPNSTVTNAYWNSATSTGIGWNNGGTVTGGAGLSISQMTSTSNFSGFTFSTNYSATGWVIVDVDGTLNNANSAAGATTPMLASEYSRRITSAHQLQLMAMDPAKSYVLGNDISAVGTSSATDVWIGSGFIPVGTTSVAFAGTLDGQKNTIDSLTINQQGNHYIGLIGTASTNAVITRLGLTNGNISGNVNVGGLVGYLNGGTVSDSFFSGSVTSSGNAAGGLVGNNSGNIQNSYAAGSVNSTASDIGGLAGNNNNSISNCYSTSTVTGGAVNVGGLVGGNYANATIKQSYSMGNVSAVGNSNSLGGFLGGNIGSVTNSYWNTTTSGQTNGIGSGTTTGASGLNSTQMMTVSSFSGWNIATNGGTTSIWRMYAGQTNPLLRSWLTPLSVMPAFNGSAQQLTGDIGAYVTNPGNPVGSEFNGSASGLTLVSTSTAGTYTATLGSANFYSTSQQGYDIDVVSNTISGNGGLANDLTINSPLSWNAGTLTLNAQRNIVINASWTVSGSGSVALQYGQSSVAAGNTSNYFINAPLNLPLSKTNYTTRQGTDGVVVNYQIISALGAPGSKTGLDLQGITGNLSGHYALGNNIDASSTASWNANTGFTPISTYSGNFDGLGHTIKGLTIKLPVTNDVGLFGNTSAGSSFRNLWLIGSNITGSNNVGALVGFLNGSLVSNCSSSGSVTGNIVGGGIGNNVGGLIGSNLANVASTIINSYASGVVTGNNDVGGLVGFNGNGTGSATISNSYTNNTVTGSNQVGGLVGFMGTNTKTGSATIKNSYATGSVSGFSNIGGLVGQLQVNGGPVTVNSSYAIGAVSGSPSGNKGGLVGFNTAATVNGSYWSQTGTGQSSSAGGTKLTNQQMKTASQLVGFDFGTPTWIIVDEDGTLNNANRADGATFPMLAFEYSNSINNAHQLQLMVMQPAAVYTLNNEINAAGSSGSGDIWSDTGFVTVGSYSVPFSGSFDGKGNAISNLSIAVRKLNHVGLFGVVGDNAIIQNTTLKGGTVKAYGGGSIGSLIGINNGVVSNCNSSASVSGIHGGFVGGLIGSNNGTINSSISSGSVSGAGGFRGGLVGNNSGTIHSCNATGSVTGQGGFSGPLTGDNSGTIN